MIGDIQHLPYRTTLEECLANLASEWYVSLNLNPSNRLSNTNATKLFFAKILSQHLPKVSPVKLSSNMVYICISDYSNCFDAYHRQSG